MRVRALLFVSICVMILFIFKSDLAAELQIYDDFEGDEIDETLWHTDSVGALSQSEGLLYISVPPTPVGSGSLSYTSASSKGIGSRPKYPSQGWIHSNTSFHGDFTVVLDWRDFYGTLLDPTIKYHQYGLEVMSSANHDDQASIQRGVGGYSSQGWIMSSIWEDGVISGWDVNSNVTASSGLFMISRVDSTISLYYDIGGGWNQSSSAAIFTEPALLHIAGQADIYGEFYVASDSISVDGQVMTPPVLDMTENEAEIALKGSGLIKGTVTRENSLTVPAVPEGLVMVQNPVGGTLLDFLSAVDVVISDGGIPDLIGEFGDLNFRSPLSSGDTVRTQINVTNIGGAATEFKQFINIKIGLCTCDDDDIYITKMYDKPVSRLAPGSSKKYNVRFVLPVVPIGLEYQLIAWIDSSEVVEELDETNNEALSECFEIVE